MRSTKVVLVVALLVGGAVASYAWLRPDPSAEHRDDAVDSPADSSDADASLDSFIVDTADRRPHSTQPQQAAQPPPSNPFPEVPRTRAGMSLEDDPFNAESVAEQEWLDRHGFPNATQWTTYSQASDSLLQLAADSGDKVAKTMLDARRLPERSALDSLLLSAVDGNDFALQLVAAHYASKGQAGYVDAYAVARVSEMRGNVSSAVSRELLFSRPLTVEQRMQGEAEALRLNSTLDRLYAEKYGTKFSADQRPISINQNGDL